MYESHWASIVPFLIYIMFSIAWLISARIAKMHLHQFLHFAVTEFAFRETSDAICMDCRVRITKSAFLFIYFRYLTNWHGS